MEGKLEKEKPENLMAALVQHVVQAEIQHVEGSSPKPAATQTRTWRALMAIPARIPSRTSRISPIDPSPVKDGQGPVRAEAGQAGKAKGQQCKEGQRVTGYTAGRLPHCGLGGHGTKPNWWNFPNWILENRRHPKRGKEQAKVNTKGGLGRRLLAQRLTRRHQPPVRLEA